MIGVHIDDRVLTDGKVDISKTVPIARCGYWQYAVIRETFEMKIPGDPRIRAGLEGSLKANRQMENGTYDANKEEERGR